MSEDNLTETQRMAIKAQSDIKVLGAKFEDLKASVELAAARNSAEHEETKGDLRVIRRLLWGALATGASSLFGVVLYLLISGAPWVSRDDYREDLQYVTQAIKELRQLHQR